MVRHTSVDEIAAAMRDKNVVAVVGAGISSEAGIPCYAVRRYHLDPDLIQRARPTHAHRALAAMTRSGHIAAVVTQNINGLERRSGIPPDQLVELHGNAFYWECTACHSSDYDTTVVAVPGERDSRAHDRGACPTCGKRSRIDNIVLVDEKIPLAKISRANCLAFSAQVMLCLGTRLAVEPAQFLPLLAKRSKVGAKVFCIQKGEGTFDLLADGVNRDPLDSVLPAIMKALGLTLSDDE
jgi:NAD-dependent SIR2 family protein deacetylase